MNTRPCHHKILASAIENMSEKRIDATGNRLRLKDGQRPEELVGQHTTRRVCTWVAAWLENVDPKHEAEKLIQRIAKWTPRAAENDKYAELDYELAVALATVREGAARSTLLKVTQVERSRGFVAQQALVDGCAPKSSNDTATAERCKDAKELKERHSMVTEGEAPSMVIESGRVRASSQSDW